MATCIPRVDGFSTDPRVWGVTKSTSGYVFTLGGETVSWRSIKQSCIVDSTMEAEYVETLEAAKEAVWLRKFLMELGVIAKVVDRMILYCDNSGVVA